MDLHQKERYLTIRLRCHSVQSVATVIAALVQVGTKAWLFANVPDICDPQQAHDLTCPSNEVFFTASAVWGLIGPVRQFGNGTVYHPELYALAIGVFLPIPFWWWQRKWPKSVVKYVNIPVLLNGPTFIPPATGINYASWFGVGLIFRKLAPLRELVYRDRPNVLLPAHSQNTLCELEISDGGQSLITSSAHL